MRKYLDDILLWTIAHAMQRLSLKALKALVSTIIMSQATVVRSVDELLELVDQDKTEDTDEPRILN